MNGSGRLPGRFPAFATDSSAGATVISDPLPARVSEYIADDNYAATPDELL